nr:hypothetical protein [Runella sp.]
MRQEPLRRVHQCVFGVLALESEAVDPRLQIHFNFTKHPAWSYTGRMLLFWEILNFLLL